MFYNVQTCQKYNYRPKIIIVRNNINHVLRNGIQHSFKKCNFFAIFWLTYLLVEESKIVQVRIRSANFVHLQNLQTVSILMMYEIWIDFEYFKAKIYSHLHYPRL